MQSRILHPKRDGLSVGIQGSVGSWIWVEGSVPNLIVNGDSVQPVRD